MTDVDGVAGLYARYARAIDDGRLEELGDCFADDATFTVIGHYEVSGRSAIIDRVRQRRAPGARHLTYNLTVEGGETSARSRAGFLVQDPADGAGRPGEYDDMSVRGSDGRWRFSSRRIRYVELPTTLSPGKLGLSADLLLTSTRSVRKRLDLHRPVEQAVVEECLALALQSPSGSNIQGWHFVTVRQEAQRAAVAEIYRRAFADYAAGSTSSARLFVDDPARHELQQRVFGSAQYLAENLHRVPCLVIPVMAGRAERLTDTHRQASFWGSILPAVWSFMLACRERGLGTSLTTMHLRYEQEMAEVLGIPFDSFTQAALIPVAHTLGTEFKSGARQPLEEVIHRDSW